MQCFISFSVLTVFHCLLLQVISHLSTNFNFFILSINRASVLVASNESVLEVILFLLLQVISYLSTKFQTAIARDKHIRIIIINNAGSKVSISVSVGNTLYANTSDIQNNTIIYYILSHYI